jgi:hypothetical protein
MSTRDLARTVIEGGRSRWNCWQRRYSNRRQRPRERDALARATRDGGLDDLIIRPRVPLWRDFHDKLSPPERWLDAQVGRPWNLVRGELLRTFDTRTTAGRHIVFDHMLPWVRGETSFARGARFTVDAHGLLRRLPRQRYRWPEHPAPLPRPEHELAGWLSGRRIAARGERLFWFIPTAGGAYRQHRLLDTDDAALWRSLPAWFQACHDPFAPRPEPKRVT